jgi:RNA polymerase sigma-70 factor (ECF subfamily)
MSASDAERDSTAATAARWFATTHWTVVLAARDKNDTTAQEALARLCSTYWYPLYAFIRRQGSTPQEAEDLTQEFLSRLIERHALGNVKPNAGKFRSFLLACLKNFLANEWDRRQAAKRGGRCNIVSWDEGSAEERYLVEPHHETTPEKLFEQSWALKVIESVLEQLHKEYADAGKAQIFEAIHSYLEEEGADTYAEMATRLNMTEGAVKMAVLRLRESFRERLRSEIAQTVADATEIDEELRHLFACLSR